MPLLSAPFFRQIVRTGTLEVETTYGNRTVVGDNTGQSLAIRFEDRAAELRLLLNPELAFGELYAEGRLTVTRGSLYDLIELIAANLAMNHPQGIASGRAALRKVLRPMRRRNSKSRSKRNVSHHYDLDRRFYDLFLDSDRQYSCAFFERHDQNLGEAQLAKKRHLAAKLLVEPGHRVLDIGSGWGGLAFYLSEHCGANVTGITLSEEQLAVSRARIDDKTLPSNVEFHLRDYRTMSGTFDRIVSVGMFEHVGPAHYHAYFRTVADLMANDGVFLLHAIGRVDGPGTTNPWFEKYIFPGGYAPALSEVLAPIEQTKLIVTDIEILRLHYAETLRLWRERFLARRHKAVALTDERFCRMWEFYLAASECGFRYNGLMVFQIQITKQQDVVPLTRDYIADKEATLRSQELGKQTLLVAAE